MPSAEIRVEIHLTLNFVQLTLNFLDSMEFGFLQFLRVDGQKGNMCFQLLKSTSNAKSILIRREPKHGNWLDERRIEPMTINSYQIEFEIAVKAGMRDVQQIACATATFLRLF